MARLTKKQKAENEARADRAGRVLDIYAQRVGCDESNLTDLLADLMHRAHLYQGDDFTDHLRRATMHFEAERDGSS